MTIIRQIKTPHPIPAILPHGPLQQLSVQPDALAEWYNDTDSNYAKLTVQSVAILFDLMGVEGAARAKLTN